MNSVLVFVLQIRGALVVVTVDEGVVVPSEPLLDFEALLLLPLLDFEALLLLPLLDFGALLLLPLLDFGALLLLPLELTLDFDPLLDFGALLLLDFGALLLLPLELTLDFDPLLDFGALLLLDFEALLLLPLELTLDFDPLLDFEVLLLDPLLGRVVDSPDLDEVVVVPVVGCVELCVVVDSPILNLILPFRLVVDEVTKIVDVAVV